MQVEINREACIGCGICYGTCDTVFESAPGDKAEVRPGETEVDWQHEACAMSAAAECPTDAITLH